MAEETLTKSDLKLDPIAEDPGRRQGPAPAPCIDQTPKEGEEVKKGATVTVLIAVGSGKVDVPNIVGPDRDRGRQGAAREAAHARARRRRRTRPPRPRSRPRSRPPRRSSRPASRSTSSSRTRPRRTTATRTATARTTSPARPRRWRGRRRRCRRRRGRARSPSRPIGKDDVETYAKKAADLGIVPQPDAPLQRRAGRPARGRRPRGRHEGQRRARRCQLIVSAGPAAGRLHQREGHPARQRRQRRRSWTRSPTTRAAGDEPDVERRGHARGLRGGRPDHAQGHHQGERGRRAALPAGSERLGNLAWAPIADTNVIAIQRAPRTGDDATCASAKITQRRRWTRTASSSRTCSPSRVDPLGAGRQVDPRRSRARTTHERRRDHALDAQGRQGAVLEQPVGLVQGPLRLRHRAPEQGHDRRGDLAGRQADRDDVQPRLLAVPAVPAATSRTTSTSRRPRRPTCAPARWRGAATAGSSS